MKKIKYIISSLILCLSATTAGVLCLDNVSVSAEEKMTSATSYTLQEVSNNMFGEKEISQSGYLYNLDGSADYVYVCFATGGYAILYEDTLELMEYAQEGIFPYQADDGLKYYAGPGNYYQGTATQLHNTITGESLSLSTTERVAFSQNLRTQLSLGKSEVELQTESILGQNGGGAEVASVPPIDEDNLIPAGTDVAYITNKDFFIKNERFGNNDYGTCGSVAVQLLLNYHNYYSDRRIIEPNYLNGGWIYKDQVGDFDIFDANNYTIPEDNPNVCNNPNVDLEGEKGLVVGSNDDFYNDIIKLVEPNLTGSSIEDQRLGLSMILLQQLGTGNFSVTALESSVYAIAEIGNNRPLLISMGSEQNGIDHAVVGYGAQFYTYPGTTERYAGFIVNFGWHNIPGSTNAWINSAWCDGYIAVNINHTHSYSEVDVYMDYLYQNRRCVCGHRIVEENHILITTDMGNNNIQIDGIDHTFKGKLVIPETVDGKTVTSIGTSAFAGQTQITEVEIPATVWRICSKAFQGCTALKTVTGMAGVTTINDEAFKDCSALEDLPYMGALVTIGDSAFWGCSSLESVHVGGALLYIWNYAFYGATNLTEIIYLGDLAIQTIGTGAFYNCSKLNILGFWAGEMVLPSIASIGMYAFKGTDFEYIILGEDLRLISSSAFANNPDLVSVTFTGDALPSVGTGVFSGAAASFKFYCAQSLIDSVTETSAWYAYIDIMAPIE